MTNNTDFDIKCYFTPNASIPFGNTQGWKRPYELGYLNLSLPADTTPEVYQYVEGQRFEDGLRAPVDFIELTKTLDQGSWCHVEMVTPSERDIFEIVPNEGTGQMMPRMKFPYRAWEINLKDSDDSSWPDPVLFRGMLTEYSIQTLTDFKKDDQQDGNWRISLDFESFDSFCLHRDINAALWYHRANATTDGYHWAFTTADSITFDDIITRIVAWMNQGRPTTDFPHSYSYTPKAASPYNLNILDPIAQALTGTVTFTNGNTAVTGSGTAFTDEVAVGDLIAPNTNIAGAGRLTYANWGKVSSITDDTNIVLTANYGGTTRNGDSGSRNANTIAIAESKDRPTWDILRDVLNYMGALEGLGLKYIPTCSVAGVIDVAYGGFDKTHAVDEDFRSTQGMQKNTSTDMTIRFNTISVPFTATVDAEYWIKFTLYRSDGAGGWTTVLTIPSSGYEYVPYDANNTHSRKYYSFQAQEITPEDTYKWDTDLVTTGSFTVALVGGSAYSPASYNFLSSPAKVKYGSLKTFAVTQGRCSQVGIYHSTTNKIGCVDGGTVAGGGNNVCPDRQGCYPDPSATPTEAVNAKYGILGIAANYADISEQNDWNTLCRLNSKRIYNCFQNTDSSIREPLEGEIVFNDGWTTNLIGSYLELYSPELDEAVTVRCIEQKHLLKGKRVTTTMRWFRV